MTTNAPDAHLNSAKRESALVIEFGSQFGVEQSLGARDRNLRQSAMCPATMTADLLQVAVASSSLKPGSDRGAAFPVKARGYYFTFPCALEDHSPARL
jgi:hypothetical protein